MISWMIVFSHANGIEPEERAFVEKRYRQEVDAVRFLIKERLEGHHAQRA